MGQKANPIGLRLNLSKKWSSRWYESKKEFGNILNQDQLIKKNLKKKYPEGAIKEIVIFRNAKAIEITIYTAKPGIIIGRSGSGMNEIKNIISSVCSQNKENLKIKLHVEELRNIENSAQLIAEHVAYQIEKRILPKRAVKQALEKLKEKGVKGARIRVSGRLGGAEIARSEALSYGSIPLHTLKQDIDYAKYTAFTTYGTVGVKVWLNLGEYNAEKEEEKEILEFEKRKQ